MKLAKLEALPVAYALREPVRTSRGEIRQRSGLRVQLVEADGQVGQGEGLPLPAFGTESLDQMEASLQAAFAELRGAAASLPAHLDCVDRICAHTPTARAALDMALHDLEARRRGVSVARLLGAAPRERVRVNAVIGSSETAECIARARAATERGFGTVKLKLGIDSLEEDLARIEDIRAALGDRVRLRGDVNGAWSEKTASAALAPLADLGLELLEQPVAAEDLDALARLARGSRVPIAADEALALPAARARLTRGILTPIAVLKPGLLGGLRAASLLARGAAASGVRVLITTSFDGPLGTAAALHLAAAVADPELACGLATLEALEGDWPATLLPVEGTLTLSSGIGLGLEAT